MVDRIQGQLRVSVSANLLSYHVSALLDVMQTRRAHYLAFLQFFSVLLLCWECRSFTIPSRLMPHSLPRLEAASITFDNFWISTVANFTVCEAPDRPPDFESQSGSIYWCEGEAVVRQSDHWSGQLGCYKIVDCLWFIDEQVEFEEVLTGRCAYSDFIKPKRKGRKTLRERGVLVKDRESEVQLMSANITFGNFWRSTQAHFLEHDYPKDREPDFQSKSGSKYWDAGDGVIRLSDHWSLQHGVKQIVDCHWTIDTRQVRIKQQVSGKCLYSDFSLRTRKRAKRISWRKLSSR